MAAIKGTMRAVRSARLVRGVSAVGRVGISLVVTCVVVAGAVCVVPSLGSSLLGMFASMARMFGL